MIASTLWGVTQDRQRSGNPHASRLPPDQPNKKVVEHMDHTGAKQGLEAKLAQCRRLAREFHDDETAKNLRELGDELEQQIEIQRTKDDRTR